MDKWTHPISYQWSDDQLTVVYEEGVVFVVRAPERHRRVSATSVSPCSPHDGGVAPLWWTDGVGQAVPSHLRLRRT